MRLCESNEIGHAIENVFSISFSHVYRCTDVQNRVCCLKKIALVRPNPRTAAYHRNMIANEIYILSNLNHPRIVRLFTSFQMAKDNHFCITMEYAVNGSLKQFLEQRHKERDRTRYFTQNVSTLHVHMCMQNQNR